MKKHKPNQASASNGTAEVFVLPPDLLAKLGINLDSTQPPEVDSPTTSLVKDIVQSVDQSIPNCFPENEDTSSIIQTANLMKESVFLSPSFFPIAPIVAPDEETLGFDESNIKNDTIISSPCDTLSHKGSRSCATLTKINSISAKPSVPQLLNNSIGIESNTERPMVEDIYNEMVDVNRRLEGYESVIEYQVENCDGQLILTNVPFNKTDNNKMSIARSDTAIMVDEHPDEAYLSDCSNSYSGCSPKSINSDINKTMIPHKNYNRELSSTAEETTTNSLPLKNICMDVKCLKSEATSVTRNSVVSLHKSQGDLALIHNKPEVTAKNKSIINKIIAENSDTLEKTSKDKLMLHLAYNKEEKNFEITTVSCMPNKQKDKEVVTLPLKNIDMDGKCELAVIRPVTPNSLALSHNSQDDLALTGKQSEFTAKIKSIINKPIVNAENSDALEKKPADKLMLHLADNKTEKNVETTTILCMPDKQKEKEVVTLPLKNIDMDGKCELAVIRPVVPNSVAFSHNSQDDLDLLGNQLEFTAKIKSIINKPIVNAENSDALEKKPTEKLMLHLADNKKEKNVEIKTISCMPDKEKEVETLPLKYKDMDVKCELAVIRPVTPNLAVLSHNSQCDLINDPIIHAENSETLKNTPLDKLISSMPDKQTESKTEITTNNIKNQNISIIDVSLNESMKSNEMSTLISSNLATKKQDSENPAQENAKPVIITNKLDSEESLQENAKLIQIGIDSNNKHRFVKSLDSNKSSNLKNNNGKEKRNSITQNVTSDQDRVKEIALYLSQIASERRNRNIYKNIEKNAKCDPITSKLCIQGVEKPGGKQSKNLKLQCVTKSYKRAITQKQVPGKIAVPDAGSIPDSFQIINNYNDTPVDGVKVRALTHQSEFCICYDFGKLAYYDCEMLYEHLHFWSHKSTGCDSETIYSIYSEDYDMLKQGVDFIKDDHQNGQDHNISIQNTLCWNELNAPKNNNEKCESASSNSKLPAKADSSKRKNNVTTTNTDDEKLSVVNDEIKKPAVKKIKCGVHKEKHNTVACEADHKLKTNSGAVPESSRKKTPEYTQETTIKPTKLKSCKSDIPNNASKNERNTAASSTKNLSEVTTKLVDKKDKQTESTKSTSKLENCSTPVQPHSISNKKSNNEALTTKLVDKKDKTPESTKNTSKLENCSTPVQPHSISDKQSNNEAITTKLVDKKDKTPESTKNTSKLENRSLPVQPHSISNKQSNNEATKCIKPSRPTKKSSSNTVPNTTTASTISTKISPSTSSNNTLREKAVSVEVPAHAANDTKNITPTTTTRFSQRKIKEDAMDTVRKSTENNSTNSVKLKDRNNSEDNSKASFSKATDTKSSRASPSTSSNTAKTTTKIVKNTNNTHQESNTSTAKSRKRSSSTSKVCTPFKKLKTTESPMNQFPTGIVDHAPNKHQTPDYLLTSIKVEKQSKTAHGVSDLRAIPSKIESPSIIDDSMNMTVEESTFQDDSEASAMECSILPPDSTMDESQSKEYFMVLAPIQVSGDLVRCGVCQMSITESEWIIHICKAHNYIAWRDGQPPLDLKNEREIKKHLQDIAYQNKGLICPKCGLVRKFAKSFLSHIETCIDTEQDDNAVEEDEPLLNKKLRKREEPVRPSYTCGVCSDSVEQTAWIEHIQLVHKYLAWTTDEQPLDLDNEKEVKEHLRYFAKYHGGLICNTCGVKWSYVKKYLKHVNECNEVAKKTTTPTVIKREKLILPPIVTCGVCKLDVEGKHWVKHIKVAHQYMAWIGGEEPLDPQDQKQMERHLNSILAAAGELVCSNCGATRRAARLYLQHVAVCERTGFQAEIDCTTQHARTDFVCGVCREVGKLSEWKNHAMTKHYNVAWKVGDLPINMKNPYAVEKLLKEYKKKYGLICRHCKNSRSSCYGFYAHILTCGKSEQEIEAVQEVCEVCNNKYLCVYRNQHMAAHRDSEQRRERRELQALRAEEGASEPAPLPAPSGKRRAAEKANKVIKKHSLNTVDGKPVCGCGTTFPTMEEYSQHECPHKHPLDDDSDASVELDGSGESADEPVDSDLSDEEDEKDRKKKRIRVGEGSTKVQRMPYRVSNYASYLAQAYKDFVELHYSSESLFSEWRVGECVEVPPDQREKYLPQVMESCKLRVDKEDEWTTLKRFEARKTRGYSMYAGGAPQCMSWAPAPRREDAPRQYLAVSAHRGPDAPRHRAIERPSHAAALQIWDFGDFNVTPRCALVVAHEWGVVWAMEWCPSGARDEPAGAAAAPPRLGLLVVACSSGAAYVLAVPRPPPAQCHPLEPVMYKLKPVAELRLTMTAERRIYQATSISWSQQKDHSTIIVGYSDGTTALYDLNTESPFLRAQERGVEVFYPYQDTRTECSSITGVGLLPTANEWHAVGGQFSASLTGGSLRGARVRPEARAHVAAAGARLSAHWPAVTLAGDAPFMRSVSELEWWGGGRRAGAGRAWASCARCARAACAAPPALRAHRHHPAYPEIKKVIVALLLMVPVGQKMKRKVNDDLSVVMEPLTYEDAAAKYGLHLKFVTRSSKSEQALAQQTCTKHELQPDRFPLSDIVALAFVPSGRFHDRIAMATHTGLIFVINI